MIPRLHHRLTETAKTAAVLVYIGILPVITFLAVTYLLTIGTTPAVFGAATLCLAALALAALRWRSVASVLAQAAMIGAAAYTGYEIGDEGERLAFALKTTSLMAGACIVGSPQVVARIPWLLRTPGW